MGGHDWTSAVQEGIKPTEQQVASGLSGFADYATMYCKHCGRISELSTKFTKDIQNGRREEIC